MDSPSFTPPELSELAARGYERVNRGPMSAAWACGNGPDAYCMAVDEPCADHPGAPSSGHANVGVGGGDESDDPLTALRRAVREMVIDECARVCEDRATHFERMASSAAATKSDPFFAAEAEECAEAIRKLSEPKGGVGAP